MTDTLNDQYIDETYDGVLHVSGDALPASGQTNIYDGLGNKSSISIGRDENGATITAPFKVGELLYPAKSSTNGYVVAQKSNGVLDLIDPLTLFGTDPDNPSDPFAIIVNLIYPVNSIILSFDNINPGIRFTGTTWVNVSQGQFLAGVGTGNDGSEFKTLSAGVNYGEYSHQLSLSALPKHTHTGVTGTVTYERGIEILSSNKATLLDGRVGLSHVADGHGSENPAPSFKPLSLDGQVFLNDTGSDGKHNNIPPSYAAYVWRRIS